MFLVDFMFQCDQDANYLLDAEELELCLRTSTWFRRILIQNYRHNTLSLEGYLNELQEGWTDDSSLGFFLAILNYTDRNGDGLINLAE